MNDLEKIKMLRNTIAYLYEKEGRSKGYIARLIEVNRNVLSKVINYEWKLKSPQMKRLKPSYRKFKNKNKNLIKSRLDKNIGISLISSELCVEYKFLEMIIQSDDVLSKSLYDYNKRNNINCND